MAFGLTKPSISLEDILDKTTEANICAYYLGIDEFPCLIKSPLRIDNNPSFSLYIKEISVLVIYNQLTVNNILKWKR